MLTGQGHSFTTTGERIVYSLAQRNRERLFHMGEYQQLASDFGRREAQWCTCRNDALRHRRPSNQSISCLYLPPPGGDVNCCVVEPVGHNIVSSQMENGD